MTQEVRVLLDDLPPSTPEETGTLINPDVEEYSSVSHLYLGVRE